MGKTHIAQVLQYLTDEDIRAARGYPSTPMPQIIGLAVAVVAHKIEPNADTYKAIVCVPRRLGLEGCENGAGLITNVWSRHGGACTWGEGRYDDTMSVYTMEVFGRWEDPVVTQE